MSDSRKVKKILKRAAGIIAILFVLVMINLLLLFVSIKVDGIREESQVELEGKMNHVQIVIAIECGVAALVIAATCIVTVVLEKRSDKQMYKYAYIDETTGLPTKAKHRQDVEARLKAANHTYAYISIEVDNFKYINEMYGYAYGNFVLQHAAKTIQSEMYEEELLSRTSGSCFGLLMVYNDDDELLQRLNAMFRKASQIKNNHGTENMYNVLFTCGVYRIKDNSEDAAHIRECANIAREAAKHLYDNNIEFYDEAMQMQRVEQAELEYEMRAAFAENQFSVYLQPKYDTFNEKIVGAEALIRWVHPQKGIIPPSKFIPLFEANGFIVKIDYYVLEQVCSCIRSWLNEGVEPIPISVNLSRIHLYDPDIVSRLVGIADRFRVPHNLIEFELTETVLFDELDYLMEVMEKLKEAGFKLSMDDFGSGYSSLNVLKKLPVDVLKLDKGFFDGLDGDEGSGKDKKIVSHIISMAKDLNMEVLAEGVENEFQRDFLLKTDCDMIQGFYYAKPMRMDQFDLSFRKLRATESSSGTEEKNKNQ